MNWRKICICTLMTTNIFISSAGAMDKPVTIVDQGSFFAGGTVIQAEGNRDFYKPTKPEGQTYMVIMHMFFIKNLKMHINIH